MAACSASVNACRVCLCVFMTPHFLFHVEQCCARSQKTARTMCVTGLFAKPSLPVQGFYPWLLPTKTLKFPETAGGLNNVHTPLWHNIPTCNKGCYDLRVTMPRLLVPTARSPSGERAVGVIASSMPRF